MTKLCINRLILSLHLISCGTLHAAPQKITDPHIQKMISLAQHIKSVSFDLIEPTDCQEIPVAQIMKYIQEVEQNTNNNNIFSRATIQTLCLTPESLLVEAYKIASQNMDKPKVLYSYDYHEDSFSDGD